MVRAGTTSKHGFEAAAFVVVAAFGCAGADSTVGPPPPPAVPHLTIDIRYLTPFTAQEQSIVAGAAEKWTHALIIDMGSFQLDSPVDDCFPGEPAIRELHHNLLLLISAEQVDGPHGVLAYTEVCGQSTRDLLPILSHIEIDRADLDSLETKGLLLPVITHEMGHALGFNPQVYTRKGLVSGGIADPYFTGITARTEFARRIPAYAGNSVPLEDVGQLGPQSSHWRGTVFGDELMIGALVPGYKHPLSSITLGLFKDIGYDVDMSAADPYPSPPIASARLTWAPVVLENDLVSRGARRMLSPVTAR